MQIEKFCQYCGKPYLIFPNQFNRSKFCSDECFRKSKNTQIDCNCDYCGEPFKIRRKKYDEASKNGRHIYCSRACADNAQKPKWSDITSLFEERGYVLLSEEYVDAKTRLEYICPEHEEFGSQYITYNNLKQGYGCRYCGIKRMADKRKLPFEKVREIFNRHDMILLDQDYQNANTPLQYICRHHKEFGIQYMSLANAYKQHCPYCNVIKGEDKISHYLLENNIYFVTHKTFDDLRGIRGGKLSYDFYLPEFNLLIEYQGEQHERPIEFFGGEDQFKIQQEHDFQKREYAKNHNIDLLEIWYYDFINLEQILNRHVPLIA